ncbi:unnamed protein product [Effrenium voratum]|nr:unnamed protein product [Effrenium voratum]
MMKTLRTLFENREDHLRTLGERVERSDWDLKLEAIRQALQEDHRERTAHAERLELLTKRVEYQEQAIEDVCFVREQVHKEAEPEVSVALLEDQVKALSLELQEMKSENDLGPRVSALLSQLREIAPKVIAHEQSIRQLEERSEEKERKLQELGQLQDQVGRLSASALALKQSASSEEEEKALRKLEELKGDWEKSLQRVQQDVQHRLAGVEEATKSQVELGISRALQAKEPALEAPEEKLQKLRQDMMEELREQRHRMEESQKELSSELHRLLLKSKGEVKAEMTTQLGAVPELLSDAREELRKELAALQDFRRSMETSEAQAALASKEAQSSSLQALEKKLQERGAMNAFSLFTTIRRVVEAVGAVVSMLARGDLRKPLLAVISCTADEKAASAEIVVLGSRVKAQNQVARDSASIERMEATSALTVATRDAVTQLERDLLALKGVPENLQEIQLAMQGFQDRLDASVEAFAADYPHCGDVFAQDSKFCRKCGKPRQRMAEASKEGLQQLQAQVAGLTERLDAFVAAQIQRGTGELPELATLAAALQKDEQEEQAAHTRLLLRIDDLCLNLSKAESGTGWVDKLEALGRQVEEMRTAEKQMEAKLEGFVSTFAK